MSYCCRDFFSIFCSLTHWLSYGSLYWHATSVFLQTLDHGYLFLARLFIIIDIILLQSNQCLIDVGIFLYLLFPHTLIKLWIFVLACYFCVPSNTRSWIYLFLVRLFIIIDIILLQSNQGLIAVGISTLSSVPHTAMDLCIGMLHLCSFKH